MSFKRYPLNPASAVEVAAKETRLTITAVKTSNYTASVNEFVPVDTTSGNVTVTLPTAPADGSTVYVKHVVRGGSNTVTVQLGGSDVINTSGGSTTGTLTLLNDGLLLRYKASTAIWYVTGNDHSLTQLDSRYIDVERLIRRGRTVGSETVPRWAATASTTPMTSGVARVAFFAAQRDEAVTTVVMSTGGTAAGATPTLVKMGLYQVESNGDLTRLDATANDTALFAASATLYSKALSGTVNVTRGTEYAVIALVVTSQTAPTVVAAVSAIANSGDAAVAPRTSAQITSQTDLQSSYSAASVAAHAHMIYAAVR